MFNTLLVANVFLISGAQLILKRGATMVSQLDFGRGLWPHFFKIIFNPYLIIGTFLYFISFVLWIYILGKIKLSFAYPIMSLSYITVMLFAWIFFKETVNLQQWLGALLIISGTSLMFLFKV